VTHFPQQARTQPQLPGGLQTQLEGLTNIIQAAAMRQADFTFKFPDASFTLEKLNALKR
jgi:hypothetical protein